MNTAQSLMNLKTISCKSDFLPDFIEKSHEVVHIRDTCTRRYLLASQGFAYREGCSSIDEPIGLTAQEFFIEDVTNRRKKLNSDPIVISHQCNNIATGKKLEDQLLLTRHSSEINRIGLFSGSGLIRFENITKIPLNSRNNKKIIAFITMYRDLTHQFSLDRLLYLYQKLYPKKKAIQKMLEHLKLDCYFNSYNFPTSTEMRVLFALRASSKCKIVAQQLGYSIATASNYIALIQDKLVNCHFYELLSKFRAMPINQEGTIDSFLVDE